MTTKTPENPLAEFANVTRQNIVGLGPEISTDNVFDINPDIRRIKKAQRQAIEQERQLAVDDEITNFSETAFFFVNGAFEVAQKCGEDDLERTILRSAISNLVESGDLLSGVEGKSQEVIYVDSLVDQLYPREDGFGGQETESERRVRIAREVIRPAIFGEIALDDEYLDHQALAA